MGKDSKGALRRWVGRHQALTVLAAAVFLIGLALGGVGGRYLTERLGRPAPAASTASLKPPLPPAPAAADPPATETSRQTVLEDEPQVALPPAAAPAPAAPSVAALPTPPGPPVPPVAGEPAWQRFALPAPATGGRPMVAVIIDDMGVDKRRSERILQLPGPLTVSLMSYADNLAHLSDEARSHGHELMMHVPMEPLAEGLDPGPGALLDRLPAAELRKRIDEDLDRFTGYVGINNHMGSKFTANPAGMRLVMEALRGRGLLFIDSLTTEHSVGLAAAQQAGVPTAGRNVFLDNDPAAVPAQLARLEELARKKGNAIAIGHPRDATIAALAVWLPTLAAKGLVLVPVTAVVRARMPAAPAAVASH